MNENNSNREVDAGVADHPLSPTIAGSSTGAIPPHEIERLTDDIVQALKSVYDPEIPADIYELGLIYKVDIGDDHIVHVEMTLTTPNCPSAAELPLMVENAVAMVSGVAGAKVVVVWDPPWDQSRMSEEARVALNLW
ncbi:MAG: SUF system Fe-S cluster assembly protein [Blastochloris sp.]|nr:SUF system Fe-S cluster assembly protein [Blastochloris sp.]